jgi:hypothetical protein
MASLMMCLWVLWGTCGYCVPRGLPVDMSLAQIPGLPKTRYDAAARDHHERERDTPGAARGKGLSAYPPIAPGKRARDATGSAGPSRGIQQSLDLEAVGSKQPKAVPNPLACIDAVDFTVEEEDEFDIPSPKTGDGHTTLPAARKAGGIAALHTTRLADGRAKLKAIAEKAQQSVVGTPSGPSAGQQARLPHSGLALAPVASRVSPPQAAPCVPPILPPSTSRAPAAAASASGAYTAPGVASWTGTPGRRPDRENNWMPALASMHAPDSPSMHRAVGVRIGFGGGGRGGGGGGGGGGGSRGGGGGPSRTPVNPSLFKHFRYQRTYDQGVVKPMALPSWSSPSFFSPNKPGMGHASSPGFSSWSLLDQFPPTSSSHPASSSPGVSLTGFRNIGNTCYLNAVLATVVHLGCFRDSVLCPGLRREVEAARQARLHLNLQPRAGQTEAQSAGAPRPEGVGVWPCDTAYIFPQCLHPRPHGGVGWVCVCVGGGGSLREVCVVHLCCCLALLTLP